MDNAQWLNYPVLIKIWTSHLKATSNRDKDIYSTKKIVVNLLLLLLLRCPLMINPYETWIAHLWVVSERIKKKEKSNHNLEMPKTKDKIVCSIFIKNNVT